MISILTWHAIAEQRKAAELHKTMVHNMKYGQIELAINAQHEAAKCNAAAMRIMRKVNETVSNQLSRP